MALLVVNVPAAPVPEGVPPSQGPITDYLRQRGELPGTESPTPTKAALRGNSIQVTTIAFESRAETRAVKVKVPVTITVQEERERIVQRDGRDVKEKYVVTVPKTVEKEVVQTVTVVVQVAVPRVTLMPVQNCKFFTVTREGKLEKIDAEKATGVLNKDAAVLSGPTAEVDPRYLERIKPGTLYLVFEIAGPIVPVAPQDEEKRPR
jgi:hypothetical protein